RAEPELDVNYYKNDLGPFDLRLFSQVVRLISINPNNPKATRWHFEPTLDLPLSNRWASLDNQLKLLATHYQQDNVNYFNDHQQTALGKLEQSVNRVMPQFKSDAKIVFERQATLANHNYSQTI